MATNTKLYYEREGQQFGLYSVSPLVLERSYVGSGSTASQKLWNTQGNSYREALVDVDQTVEAWPNGLQNKSLLRLWSKVSGQIKDLGLSEDKQTQFTQRFQDINVKIHALDFDGISASVVEGEEIFFTIKKDAKTMFLQYSLAEVEPSEEVMLGGFVGDRKMESWEGPQSEALERLAAALN